MNSPPPSHRSVLVPDTGGGARVTRGAKVRPLTADGGGTSETETASTSGVVAAAAGTELRYCGIYQRHFNVIYLSLIKSIVYTYFVQSSK